MAQINIIGGSAYPQNSRRPVGKYGGRYVRSGSGLFSDAPRQYTTFTNTRWQPMEFSDKSALYQAAASNRENFIPRTTPVAQATCQVSGNSHNGECGEAISRILSRFSSDLTAPNVFGPPAWFTYHNGTAHLPENLTLQQQMQLLGFIRGIPLMTPCGVCQTHATKYINDHDSELREAIKTRDGAFAWFVEFHNFVNLRNGKPTLTVDEARTLYRVDNQCTVQF